MKLKEMIARGAADGAAVLLILAYFFLPEHVTDQEMNNSGRKKLDLIPGESVSWSWTPAAEGTHQAAVRLSGMKKAQEMTFFAEIRDGAGELLASAEQRISDLGDGDVVRLEGSFPAGKACTLTVRAEGGGALRIRGEETEETGEFYPLLMVSSVHDRQNPALLYFAAGALLSALTPVFGAGEDRRIRRRESRGRLAEAMPWITFFTVASVGMLITVCKPLFETGAVWNSWDEEVHWIEVRHMSLWAEGGIRELLAQINTSTPGYVPLAVGYNLARIFTKDVFLLYHAAVGVSCLFYAAMCALAVKHAPRYKATFLAAGTLPTFLFLCTSATYDTVTAGVILLGVALTLEAMDGEARMTPLRAITLTALLSHGLTAKLLYSPILFFTMLIPDRSFRSRRQAWMFRVFALVMFIWCVAAVSMSSESVWQGDARFEGASTPDQLAYMLANPIEGGLRPMRLILENLPLWLRDGISHWAYAGNNRRMNSLYLWLMLIAAPLCTAGEDPARKGLLTPVRRIFLGGIAMGCEFLFAYSLYLTSTPVGDNSLGGMQARYFMPVWIAMALALMWPRGIRKRLGRMGDWMTAGVCLACFGFNLWNALEKLIGTGVL